MIYIYTGTPGSGKSLHVAEKIRARVQRGGVVITNFIYNCEVLRVKEYSGYMRIKNEDLTPEFLVDFSDYYKDVVKKVKHLKEESITLVIDECQLIFNSRDWKHQDRMGWISFFSQHRKLGYEIILVAQDKEMIDKQIRALIEYEIIHRKVKNINKIAALISMVAGGGLHVNVKIYLPLNERVGSEWYRADKSLYLLYDSYTRF